MALYVNSRTRVKTMTGISEEFHILVGVHQGSVLSLLLFIIGVPWKLIFADNLARQKNQSSK